MARTRSNEDAAGTVVGVAAVLTGGGALTFALFPLLLPTVVLLGVLALPLLPLAILGALLYPLVRLIASLRRRRTRRQRDGARGLAPVSQGSG